LKVNSAIILTWRKVFHDNGRSNKRQNTTVRQ
jgi:hypothetical protein